MNKHLYIVLLLGSLFFSPKQVVGQISAPGADLVKVAEYPSGFPREDKIFIVCSSTANGDPVTAGLTGTPPAGYGVVNFEWSTYDDEAGSYNPPFFTETGNSSVLTGLGSGGYRLRIFDGASLDTMYYAWLFIDIPFVSCELQVDRCSPDAPPFLVLLGKTAQASFNYFDPADNSAVGLENGILFKWEVADPDTKIPKPTLDLNPQVFNPPVVDTRFSLTVSDSMGCTDIASFDYETIHVKADFQPEPSEGEAPLEVSFLNKSINAVSYNWDFGDGKSSFLESPELHNYYVPMQYVVTLFATSEKNCTDSVTYRYITVEPSKLDIPNVFTPNEDGYNDMFVVSAKSLRYLRVKVMSRNGRKIYEFEGNSKEIKEWEGWDGRIAGKQMASPGIYYYIVEALGWDDVEYKPRIYRGSLHLIREKR